MEGTEYYDKLRDSVSLRGWGELPRWSELDEAHQETVAVIVKRLALAQSLAGDLEGDQADQGADDAENTALKLYLLLTCVNVLGQADQDTAAMDFPTWLAANKTTNNHLDADTLPDESEPEAESETPPEDSMESLATAYEDFQSRFGSKSNFMHVFTKCIDHDVQRWIGNHCWVYEDDPIENWSTLHLVQKGYNESKTAEYERLTKARKRWDALTLQKSMVEIADICESIHHQFAVCISPMPLRGMKDPVPKVLREIGVAMADQHVNYLSETAFRKLDLGGTHTVIIDNIDCIIKDSELYVRLSNFEDRDTQSWQDQVLIWNPKQITRGEAITLPDMKRALVLPDKPLVDHLNDWIENALSQFISNHQAARHVKEAR